MQVGSPCITPDAPGPEIAAGWSVDRSARTQPDPPLSGGAAGYRGWNGANLRWGASAGKDD